MLNYLQRRAFEMRLWHQDLIPALPRQQLPGQHRECAALRGGGWGKKHATVDYVFNYSPYRLYAYHQLVIDEMKARGYHPDPAWEDKNYRGKKCAPYSNLEAVPISQPIYPEHDVAYMDEWLANLKSKEITL